MDREVVKKYLDFINEGMSVVSFIGIRRKFDELFPTKEKYEEFIIFEANELYGGTTEDDDYYEINDIRDVGESEYNKIIETTLIWYLIQKSGNNVDEIPVGEMLELDRKIRRYIDKKFYE